MHKENKTSSIVLVLLVHLVSLHSCSLCKPNKMLPKETTKVEEVSTTEANIYTDIIINASTKKVWETLTDFEKMAGWSSTIKGISGEIKNGGSVVVKVDIGNNQHLEVPRSPFIYEEGHLFGWSGKISRFEGFTDNHTYKIEAISKCQSRFIQTEQFKGSNPNITPIVLANRTVERYKIFNQELKKEVEQRNHH